jgi:carbon storage regulator CsrA
MLVLSRRLNQAIVIAGQVRVTVVAITPNRVELGVEAPREILVDREEIHVRRQVDASSGHAGFPDAEAPQSKPSQSKPSQSKLGLAVMIRREIVTRGWSQARAAALLGISEAQVAALLHYRLEDVSVDWLAGLARALTAPRCRIPAANENTGEQRS